MAIKNFSTGEVLTSSDTNTYLANSGLVYVGGATVTNQSFFEVTGFSSTYIRYEIIISLGAASTPANSNLSVVYYDGATARNTNYYGSGWYTSYLAASGTTGIRANQADMNLSGAGAANNTQSFYKIIVQGVTGGNKATMMGTYYDNYGLLSVNFGYLHDLATTRDRIRFTPSGGNVTGSWRLFGYREP